MSLAISSLSAVLASDVSCITAKASAVSKVSALTRFPLSSAVPTSAIGAPRAATVLLMIFDAIRDLATASASGLAEPTGAPEQAGTPAFPATLSAPGGLANDMTNSVTTPPAA